MREEAIIDGTMCYRTDPDSDFKPYTLEELSLRYEKIMKKYVYMKRTILSDIAELNNVLYDIG